MFKKLRGWWLTPRKRRPIVVRPRPTIRLSFERLEDRMVLAINFWIAPVGGNGRWDFDTNWSLGTQPNVGQDIRFDDAHSKAPCMLASGVVVGKLNSITFGDWSSSLGVGSNLTADTITLLARTNAAAQELNLGAALKANTSLTINGGSVYGGGSGTLEGDGTITISGTSATDKPTLGAMLIVGSADGTKPGTMTFASASQPLVVTGNGNITVNSNSKIVFLNTAPMGQNTVTAVSNGDAQAHSIILSGGELDRANSCECYVGMGVQVTHSSILGVGPDRTRGDVGPLHLTGWNSDGFGLDFSTSSQADLFAGLAVDRGANVSGGQLTVEDQVTLTLGVGPASAYSMQSGGSIYDGGTILAHGGLALFGGTTATKLFSPGAITVDAGNQVWLDGGEIDVTNPNPAQGDPARGSLTITGLFYATAGKIVDNVNSTSTDSKQGTFVVKGDMNLASNVIFSSKDLSGNPAHNITWTLLTWTGARTGAFGFDLPAGWTSSWDDVNKRLHIVEP